MLGYILLLLANFAIRIPYFKMPVHGDAGYFVSPRCTEKRMLSLAGGWYSGVGAASKLLPSFFYQVCYIISPRNYKYISRIAFSLLVWLASIYVGKSAYILFGANSYAASMIFILYMGNKTWRSYVESGDQFNAIFASAIIYSLASGYQILAIFLMSIDIWFCKQSAIFLYVPLGIYLCFQHPYLIPWFLIIFLSVLIYWINWTFICGFKSPVDALVLLVQQQKFHKGSNSWLKQYRLKMMILSKQLLFSAPLVLLSIYGLSQLKVNLLPLLLFLGMLLAYLFQTNVCSYFALPMIVPLTLLAAISPIEAQIVGMVVWMIFCVFVEITSFSTIELFAHTNKALLIERLFKRFPIPPGKVMGVVGNDTQVYLLSPGAVCPSPEWITYSWLWGRMTGNESIPEKYDYYYISSYGDLPPVSKDYKVLAKHQSQRGGIMLAQKIQ